MNVTKQNLFSFAKDNYNILILIILLIGVVILWQHNISLNKDIETLKNSTSINKTINDIDSKLDDINKRNSELYPQLQQKMNDLEKARLSYSEAERKLKQKTKKEIENEISKLNADQISKYLLDLNIPNSVYSSK